MTTIAQDNDTMICPVIGFVALDADGNIVAIEHQGTQSQRDAFIAIRLKAGDDATIHHLMHGPDPVDVAALEEAWQLTMNRCRECTRVLFTDAKHCASCDPQTDANSGEEAA